MLHKAWNSKGKMPYSFPRSSIKFQGHTGQNITDFDPNYSFPDYRLVAAFKSLRFAFLNHSRILALLAIVFVCHTTLDKVYLILRHRSYWTLTTAQCDLQRSHNDKRCKKNPSVYKVMHQRYNTARRLPLASYSTQRITDIEEMQAIQLNATEMH